MRSAMFVWSIDALFVTAACWTSSALAANPAAVRPADEIRATTQGISFLEPREEGAVDALSEKKRAESQADSTRRAAQDLVAQALLAEANGIPALRKKFLNDALSLDPDCEAAHWQLGEIRVGSEWKSIKQATADTAKAGVVNEYRNRRGRAGANADDQYKLSRWCSHVGLKQQERAHLVFVLQLQPNHAYANKRLKALQREDEETRRASREFAQRQAKEAAAAFKEWRPRLISLRRDAESRDPERRELGLEGLAAVNDVAALPAIENVFADAEGKVASAVIESLANINDQRAVDSLVRYSVNARNSVTRENAGTALANHSMFSYVPSMMSILVPPTRMQYTMAFNSKGDLGYRMTLYQEGPMGDVETSHTMTNQDFLNLTANSTERRLEIDENRLRQRDMQTVAMARNIEAANAARAERNKNIAEALRASTGNKFDDSATSWWNWWLDYNEIYRTPEKPVSRSQTEAQVSLTYSRMPERPSPSVSVQTSPTSLGRISHPECFAAGTTVWTSTGPMPIERVAVGESVLSQNTTTGEIVYKLVLATTIRPVSPLVAIRAGDETIRATRGHPFWVSGQGWRMAKELRAGQWLHTANGPQQVVSVADDPEALAYNMLLEDYNTYFVTNSMFLVHDNLIREVSPATVPGMAVASRKADR